MAVSEDKRYEYIARQLEYKNEKIIQGFEIFIKLFVAISAGVIWLKTQKFENNFLKTLIIPIISILILLGSASIAIIMLNLMSWWGFRKAQVKLIPDILPPRHVRSYIHELILIVIIFGVTILASCYLKVILIPK